MNDDELIISPYSGNKQMILITGNEGFEPMFECKQILINKLGFVLVNEFGVTNMIQDYLYNKKQYSLNYIGRMNLIVFMSEINNDLELKEFKNLGKMLIEERRKIKNKPYNK